MSHGLKHIDGGQFVRGGMNIGPDFSFPGVACDIGWSLRRVQKRADKVVVLARIPKTGCEHRGADGTIACPDCSLAAGDFIAAAGEYLRERADE